MTELTIRAKLEKAQKILRERMKDPKQFAVRFEYSDQLYDNLETNKEESEKPVKRKTFAGRSLRCSTCREMWALNDLEYLESGNDCYKVICKWCHEKDPFAFK